MARDINSFLSISNNLYSFAVDNFNQAPTASPVPVGKDTSLQQQSQYSLSGSRERSKPKHQKSASADDFFFTMNDVSPKNLKDSFEFILDDEEHRRVEMKSDNDGHDDLHNSSNNSDDRIPNVQDNLTLRSESNHKTPVKSAPGSGGNSSTASSKSIFSGLSFFKSLVSTSKTSMSRKAHSRNQSLDAEHDLEANILGSKFITPPLATTSSSSNSNSNSNSNNTSKRDTKKKNSIRHSRSNSNSYFFNDIYGRKSQHYSVSPLGSSDNNSGRDVVQYQESPLKTKDDHLTSFSCSVEYICFDFIR